MRDTNESVVWILQILHVYTTHTLTYIRHTTSQIRCLHWNRISFTWLFVRFVHLWCTFGDGFYHSSEAWIKKYEMDFKWNVLITYTTQSREKRERIRKREDLKRKITWVIKWLVRAGCIVPHLFPSVFGFFSFLFHHQFVLIFRFVGCYSHSRNFPFFQYLFLSVLPTTHLNSQSQSQSHCTLMNALRMLISHHIRSYSKFWLALGFRCNICPQCARLPLLLSKNCMCVLCILYDFRICINTTKRDGVCLIAYSFYFSLFTRSCRYFVIFLCFYHVDTPKVR